MHAFDDIHSRVLGEHNRLLLYVYSTLAGLAQTSYCKRHGRLSHRSVKPLPQTTSLITVRVRIFTDLHRKDALRRLEIQMERCSCKRQDLLPPLWQPTRTGLLWQFTRLYLYSDCMCSITDPAFEPSTVPPSSSEHVMADNDRFKDRVIVQMPVVWQAEQLTSTMTTSHLLARTDIELETVLASLLADTILVLYFVARIVLEERIVLEQYAHGPKLPVHSERLGGTPAHGQKPEASL